MANKPEPSARAEVSVQIVASAEVESGGGILSLDNPLTATGGLAQSVLQAGEAHVVVQAVDSVLGLIGSSLKWAFSSVGELSDWVARSAGNSVRGTVRSGGKSLAVGYLEAGNAANARAVVEGIVETNAKLGDATAVTANFMRDFWVGVGDGLEGLIIGVRVVLRHPEESGKAFAEMVSHSPLNPVLLTRYAMEVLVEERPLRGVMREDAAYWYSLWREFGHVAFTVRGKFNIAHGLGFVMGNAVPLVLTTGQPEAGVAEEGLITALEGDIEAGVTTSAEGAPEVAEAESSERIGPGKDLVDPRDAALRGLKEKDLVDPRDAALRGLKEEDKARYNEGVKKFPAAPKTVSVATKSVAPKTKKTSRKVKPTGKTRPSRGS